MTAEFLFRRAATIYGGSNEVQRNIVSKLVLSQGVRAEPPAASEERRLLEDSVARFIEKRYTFEERRKRLASGAEGARRSWRELADNGWLAAAIPETFGGLGGGIEGNLIVLAGVGRGLMLDPYLALAVLAPKLIELAGSEAQKREWLPGLANGERVLAVAHEEAGARGHDAHVATRVEGGHRLQGTKQMVVGGDLADSYLISARVDGDVRDARGIDMFVVARDAPGLTVSPYRTIDGRQVVDLRLEGTPAERFCSGDAALGEALDHARVGAGAEAVGAMEAALSLTLEYVKTRKQFGQPLAAFQALQHRLADMLVELERARSMLFRATAALSAAPEERSRIVSAAKVCIGRSGLFVGQQGVQLHGGIGMTEDYAIGHYLKRLMTLDALYGDARHHQNRYARLMDAQG